MSQDSTHADEARILGALERQHAGPKAFRAMSAPVWRNGHLSEKDKHLVAVAVAQVTRCAFCIEHHAELARKGGASESEALAVSYITAALESLGDAALSIGKEGFALENEPHLTGTSIATARAGFVQAVFDTDALKAGFVSVIAAAVAYAQSNEARRQLFHRQALEAGEPLGALDEAYSIVVVLRAGAVYAHTLHVASVFADG
ncbi:MAG: carboxymuconolactone decarboxylase family protein [Pandoraea sp.]|nr:carboxymuconolactone decarboxylase family protein [Pandoraea sp.]MDR3397583.1 carboxymuconolactone decarboxylase family protein [Pandoraea sp.]